MGKLTNFLFVIITFTLLSCNIEDGGELCGKSAVIDNSLFTSTNTNNYTITKAEIKDNCLIVKISSGGCSGNSWKLTLIDSSNIAESLPEQRFLKLALENTEVCLAIVTKEFSFDISNLQTTNSQIILNLEKWNQQINYEY